ncbi:MAG: Ig-like domain-containing protein [Bacteroidales bacterium]|nr:Ig-like domain-containing protein [Bacteroidales bacterium]MBN2818854.1 Ig-like domain-containing protein [Bacteroidales bacterium]
MKKNLSLVLLPLLLLFFGNINAQVLVADWDTQDPANCYPWSGTTNQNVSNPDASGINTSAEVLEYVRAGGNLYESFIIEFTEEILIKNPVLKFQVYYPAASTGALNVILNDSDGKRVGIISKTITTKDEWVDVSIDFAGSLLPAQKCKQLRIDVDHGTDNSLTYYFDDLRFESGFSSGDDVVIAREKFAGNPNTWESYAGYVKDATNWTCANGRISNDTIVINRYPGATTTTGYVYPEPSGVAMVELGQDGDINGTDTLILSGIDVKNFTDYRIIFSSGGYYNTTAPNVWLKVDNGAWSELTYTALDSVNNQIIQHEIATGVTSADSIAIMLTESASWKGQWLDDLGLIGTPVSVSSIGVSSEGDATTLKLDNTLKMSYAVSPLNALIKEAEWSVVAGTGTASISSDSILTPITVGTVTVRATAKDGSGVIGEKTITILNADATGIEVSSTGDATEISTNDGTLQMIATVTPANASQDVVWTLEDVSDSDTASISSDGLLTAIRNGIVGVKATTDDGTDLSDVMYITLSSQIVEPTALVIADATVDQQGVAVQMTIESSTPEDADKSVTWSIESDDADTATITTDGLLTPIRNGVVTVKATSSLAGVSVSATKDITLTNQVIDLESISITGDNITTNAGTSQMTAVLTPSNAADVSIVWSLSSGSDSLKATISASGLITAYRNGSITVVAVDENSDIQGTKDLTISGQVLVDSIGLIGADNVTTITESGGSLQINAEILPVDARIQDIVWSVSDNTLASVNQTGLVQAKANGDVYVIATAIDDGARADSIQISISGQVLVADVNILTDSDTIKVNGSTLTLPIDVSPNNASDTTVTWSIISSDADTASIDSETGLITPIRNGSIKVMAVANANSDIKDSAIVVIMNQIVAPTNVVIINNADVDSILINDGTLNLEVNLTPLDASADISWSVDESDVDTALVDENGVVTALRNGTIKVIAVSNIDNSVTDTFEIAIINQVVEPSSISIEGTDNATTIESDKGTLKLLITTTPADADKSVTWSIDAEDTGIASVDDLGEVTALENGTASVIAISIHDSEVADTFEVTITGQIVLVTSIEIIAEGGATSIDSESGTLQLTATVRPDNATDNSVEWSSNDENIATVSESGLVTAIADGSVTITASAQDGSDVEGSINLTISNQTVGLSDIHFNTLEVYPNPVSDKLYIENLNGVSMVKLISSTGAVSNVTSEFITNNSINVYELQSGLYIIQLIANDEVFKAVFIKE